MHPLPAPPPRLQGRPKGVEISHGGLRDLIAFFVEKMELGAPRLLAWCRQCAVWCWPAMAAHRLPVLAQQGWTCAAALRLPSPAPHPHPHGPTHPPSGPDDVFCLNTTVCFDPYVLYLYGCLAVGGCLVIPKPDGHVGE